MTEAAEAIVIGAGPAGLAAAKCLADIGIKPLVLEKEIAATLNTTDAAARAEFSRELKRARLKVKNKSKS